MRENYECDIGGCPAGYDGLHPNVLGEHNSKETQVVSTE